MPSIPFMQRRGSKRTEHLGLFGINVLLRVYYIMTFQTESFRLLSIFSSPEIVIWLMQCGSYQVDLFLVRGTEYHGAQVDRIDCSPVMRNLQNSLLQLK